MNVCEKADHVFCLAIDQLFGTLVKQTDRFQFGAYAFVEGIARMKINTMGIKSDSIRFV